MIKRLVTRGLHHHFEQLQSPFVCGLHTRRSWVLSKQVGFMFLLKSAFWPLNTIQDGTVSSDDAITYFLGVDSNQCCSEQCGILKGFTHISREQPKTWTHLFGEISHPHFLSYEKIVTSFIFVPSIWHDKSFSKKMFFFNWKNIQNYSEYHYLSSHDFSDTILVELPTVMRYRHHKSPVGQVLLFYREGKFYG